MLLAGILRVVNAQDCIFYGTSCYGIPFFSSSPFFESFLQNVDFATHMIRSIQLIDSNPRVPFLGIFPTTTIYCNFLYSWHTYIKYVPLLSPFFLCIYKPALELIAFSSLFVDGKIFSYKCYLCHGILT